MKELQKKAVEICKARGAVTLIDCNGGIKVLYNEKDVKACFKLAAKGVIDEWTMVK